MRNSSLVFVAIIATCNRAELLAERALPSVAAQTRPPDLLIVVDDSNTPSGNQKTVSEFSANTNIRTIYVVNNRASGASGCWNCGVLACLAECNARQNTYLAILDDDDEWLPHHLANADAVLQDTNYQVDFLAASHQRRENTKMILVSAPKRLRGSEFLVSNPGIIGSTIIIRLTTFMRAGMFDESLPACTDRDLCFRVSLLRNVRYCNLHDVSVVHYASIKRPRLSSYGSKEKILGLARFADKYFGWMNAAEQQQYEARAERLFGWRQNDHIHLVKPSVVANEHVAAPTGEKIALLIGVIIDPRQPHNSLLDDILQLAKDTRLSSVDVVVISCCATNVGDFHRIIKTWRGAGLRVYGLHNLTVDSILRALGMPATRQKKRPISVNRMVLQYAAASVGEMGKYRAPVYWILDGDMRLHGLNMMRGKLSAFTPDYIGEMLRLRATGCDVAVGDINGAPPLPRALSVRTQLVDLMHFCARLRKSPGARNFPAQTLANAAHYKISTDYYHDCGDHSHLEQPIGLPPLPMDCSYQSFIHQLPQLIDKILAGHAVTRPLLNHAIAQSGSRTHRGGNTLIFNAQVLLQCPNGLGHEAFAKMRRQDEIWCIVGQAVFGWKFTSGQFPTTQDRCDETAQAPDIARLEQDVVGHSLASALKFLVASQQFKSVSQFSQFMLRHDSNLHAVVKNIALDRTTMLRASFFRIVGLAGTIRRMIDQNFDKEKAARASAKLLSLEKKFFNAMSPVTKINRLFEENKFQKLVEAISKFPKFCCRLQNLTNNNPRLIREWMRDERQKNATHLLPKIVGANTRLRFLGRGGEGTVFTDNHRVYKILHRWYSVDHPPDIPHADFMCRALQGTLDDWNANSDALYPILNSWREHGDLVLEMPYEKTHQYLGGCGAGMVAMLSELKLRGVVLWDIKPSNLRRKGKHIRLVDYGYQIHPFTERNFDLAARKAWLCYRYATRRDLRALLTQSLNSADLPQLRGYIRMRKAAEKYATCFRTADTALDKIFERQARRVLDYGCGDGQNAIAMAGAGLTVHAYDPNLSTTARQKLTAAGVTVLTKKQLLAAGQYDAILFRHVLCEILRDADLLDSLQTAYRLLAARGCAVISACDMEHPVKHKLYEINRLPSDADCKTKFFYRKHIRKNGSVHQHVHRPQRELELLFHKIGFRIASCEKFHDINLETFEQCGGAVQWTLVC